MKNDLLKYYIATFFEFYSEDKTTFFDSSWPVIGEFETKFRKNFLDVFAARNQEVTFSCLEEFDSTIMEEIAF